MKMGGLCKIDNMVCAGCLFAFASLQFLMSKRNWKTSTWIIDGLCLTDFISI